MRRLAYWGLSVGLALVLSSVAYHFLYRDARVPAVQQSARAAIAPAEEVATVEVEAGGDRYGPQHHTCRRVAAAE